jgi:Nucleotidyl transferase AbiEii toxin, Type IV TA system
MPRHLEPKFSILPAAQRQIWTSLAPALQLSFVLYGGTAVALHLGHRESLDFDFFRYEPLDKDQVRDAFGFVRGAAILRALGYFEDGDLATLDKVDQNLLRNARDKIQRLPSVIVKSGSLTGR